MPKHAITRLDEAPRSTNDHADPLENQAHLRASSQFFAFVLDRQLVLLKVSRRGQSQAHGSSHLSISVSIRAAPSEPLIGRKFCPQVIRPHQKTLDCPRRESIQA